MRYQSIGYMLLALLVSALFFLCVIPTPPSKPGGGGRGGGSPLPEVLFFTSHTCPFCEDLAELGFWESVYVGMGGATFRHYVEQKDPMAFKEHGITEVPVLLVNGIRYRGAMEPARVRNFVRSVIGESL